MSNSESITAQQLSTALHAVMDRLEAIEERIALQGARMDSLKERCTALSERTDGVVGMCDALREGVNVTEEKLDEWFSGLEMRIQDRAEETETVGARVDDLESHVRDHVATVRAHDI